ncbi:MAG: hypothetical protein J0G32_00265 [Alphaproteobacteria bacterium]|nr:hypothetical protein [Alphaproteobacteria bacterium]OJV13586.1 MAG: hypothetical protein BGO27_03110 [Alphaproteobacteria bacterium 33-17]
MVKIEFGTALIKSLKSGYNLKDFKSDAISGLVVSLVSLPLAMALAIAVGLNPSYGVYTAMVAGFFAALLGGSKTQVSGPTAAFVAILAPIYTKYGIEGLITSQFMAGIIVIFMSVFRLGKYMKYMPHSIVLGFTTGIAIVIFVISLKDFLGFNLPKFDGYLYYRLKTLLSNINTISLADMTIGLTTLLLIRFWHRIPFIVLQKLPSIVGAIFITSIISYIAIKNGYDIKTIESTFSFIENGIKISGIPNKLPDFSGNLIITDSNMIVQLLPSAFMVALLASLESLLSARMADSLAGTKHDSNSELFGIGFANFISSLFQGMPATGAIARTATNIKSGAKSPISSMICSLLVTLYVLTFAHIIDDIPMAALSAVLINTAINMIEIKEIKTVLKSGLKEDSIALIVTIVLTATTDMIIGVASGMATILLLNLKHFKEKSYSKIEGQTLQLTGDLTFSNFDNIFTSKFTNLNQSNITIDLSNIGYIDLSSIKQVEYCIENNEKNINIKVKAKDKIKKLIEGLTNLSKERFI